MMKSCFGELNWLRFVLSPPLFFYLQYVFPMYFLSTRLFSSMAFLSEMHSLGDIGWVGLGWVGLGWVGLGWVGLGWVGLGWVGLGWVGLGWVGLGWVGLG